MSKLFKPVCLAVALALVLSLGAMALLPAGEVRAQAPVADFSANTTSGTAPLDVGFTDQSTGNVTGWLWDFGDTGSSTLQNPSYTYNSPGLYTVSLNATGPDGSDIETKLDYIHVFQGVEASWCAEEGDEPLEVCFTDESTGDVSGWLWDFGDDETSDEQNPCHTYEEAGTYEVCLTVYGEGGDEDTSSEEITVYGVIRAEFTGEQREGFAPLVVEFTDLSGGQVDEWSWDFGDGETSDDEDPTHVYTRAGVYTVSLRVEGPAGRDREIKDDYIWVRAGTREQEKPLAILPANLVVINLNISPAEVYPNEAVFITADVVNEGDIRGSKQLNLVINGYGEQNVTVDVPGRSSQPISFTVYKADPAVYSAYIDGTTGYFTVLYPEAAAPLGGGPLDTGGIIAIVIIGIILIAGVILAVVLIRPGA